jgi:hypothetical protein
LNNHPRPAPSRPCCCSKAEIAAQEERQAALVNAADAGKAGQLPLSPLDSPQQQGPAADQQQPKQQQPKHRKKQAQVQRAAPI